MRKLYSVILLALLISISFQCGEEDTPPASDEKQFLSEYNFFVGDLADLIPNTDAGVIPYDLNMPLFSDYALKKRFVFVPEGKSIPFEATGTLDLPEGSILIKQFYYEEGGIEDLIETRLLIHEADGWKPETYIWNSDKSDAERSKVGESRQMTINVNGSDQIFNYLIPNENQCKNCHGKDGKIEPIGPVVSNLNKSYTYTDGTTNQIDKWISLGILDDHDLTDVPQWPTIDDGTASLDTKARAYLASNCSSCHRPGGAAFNSGLFLEYENDDDASLGIFKRPVAAGAGAGGLEYDILPGDAENSIMYYRMNSSEVEVRMPELGRELIHEEGVELIKNWINNLEG